MKREKEEERRVNFYINYFKSRNSYSNDQEKKIEFENKLNQLINKLDAIYQIN